MIVRAAIRWSALASHRWARRALAGVPVLRTSSDPEDLLNPANPVMRCIMRSTTFPSLYSLRCPGNGPHRSAVSSLAEAAGGLPERTPATQAPRETVA